MPFSHSAHGGIETTHQRGGTRARWADAHRDLSFLSPAFVKLGVSVLRTGATPASSPHPADAMPARLLTDYRCKKIALLAPLSSRARVRIPLCQWGGFKGFTHLRRRRQLDPEKKWPRLDRFFEHNTNCRWLRSTSGVSAKGRDADEQLDVRRCKPDTAWCCASGNPARCLAMVVSTKPPARTRQREFPELVRGCSHSIQNTAVKSCFGTGVHLPQFRAEQMG